MFGSDSAEYWGSSLTREEYLYVLKVKFGADDAVDLRGLAGHVDYFVFFIPDQSIALVSEPVLENYELALAALRLMKDQLTQIPVSKIDGVMNLLRGTPSEVRKT